MEVRRQVFGWDDVAQRVDKLVSTRRRPVPGVADMNIPLMRPQSFPSQARQGVGLLQPVRSQRNAALASPFDETLQEITVSAPDVQ
jgi:hypothetical protein